MNYYQLSTNLANKKWSGYENPSPYLWDNNEELNELYLDEINNNWEFETLEYRNLKEGKVPPIHSLGCTFILFDADIPNVNSISSSGVQLFPVINKSSLLEYLVNQVDCVDWERSEVDKWPEGHTLKKWHNKRGRFFIKPVLSKNKIPEDLEAFRLQEGGSAFNIMISEDLKKK